MELSKEDRYEARVINTSEPRVELLENIKKRLRIMGQKRESLL